MLRTRCRRDAGVNPLTSGLPRVAEACGPCVPTPIFERYKMSPAFNKLHSTYTLTTSRLPIFYPPKFPASLDRLSCAVILSSSSQSSRQSSAPLHSFHHQTCPSSSFFSRSTISVPWENESRCAPTCFISSVTRPVGKSNLCRILPNLPYVPTNFDQLFRASRLLQTKLDYFSHENGLHTAHQKYLSKSA